MPHRSSSSPGFHRSPSAQTQYLDPVGRPVGQMQSPFRLAAAALPETAGLYDLPSVLDVSTPPPAYDLGVISMPEPVQSSNNRQSTLAKPFATGSAPHPQAWQDHDSTHARRVPRGPRRPILPARPNSEFIPYSAHYYLIRTDQTANRHPSHSDHTQNAGSRITNASEPSLNLDQPTSKRKVNKLKKPRPVAPHLTDQAKPYEGHNQTEDCRPSFNPSPRTKYGALTRVITRNLKKGSKGDTNNGPLPQNVAPRPILPRHRTSREFRDEKRLALVNSEDHVYHQEIPSDFIICLHCQFHFSDRNQLNFHIDLNHSRPHFDQSSQRNNSVGSRQSHNGGLFFT